MKSYVWRSYRGPMIAGAVLTVIVILSNGVLKSSSVLEAVRLLCDAFCISGGILLCVGGLSWVSSTGMFDSLIHATRQFGQAFKPADQRMEETLEQYVQRKKSHPVLLRRYLVPGGIYFAIGMIFLVVFYCLY